MTMRTLSIVAVLALLAFAGAAFAAGTQTATAGKYTVELATKPSPPAVGENQVIVTVTDGGKPVKDAAVAIHSDMAGMSMPADVEATPGDGAGQYKATVDLGMEGKWTLAVKVQQMAGMAMAGDGVATFTVTAAGAAPAPGPAGAPAQPRQQSGPPLLLIIGAVVVGIVAAVAFSRKRGTPNPQA
jgi:hypothetical protein